MHEFAAVLRANAWERSGEVERAVELLRLESRRSPAAGRTVREIGEYFASLPLCAASLARLDAPLDAVTTVPAPVVDAAGPAVVDAAGETVGAAGIDAGPTDAGPSEVAEAGVAAPDASATPLRGDAGGSRRPDATSAGDPGAGEGGPRVRVLSVEGRADEVNYFAMLAQTRTQTPRLARGCGLPATWRGTVIIVFSHIRGASGGSSSTNPSGAGPEVWEFVSCVRDGLWELAAQGGGTGGDITVRFAVE
jgi:hypothetical protein